MQGTSHKAIGVAVGVSMLLYGIQSDQSLYAIGLASAPLGAMLPDIDHDRSKLGSTRDKITSIISVVVTTMFFASLAWAVILTNIRGEPTAFVTPTTLLPIYLCIFIANNKKFRKKFKFFMKHRGIMHTLIIPGALWIATEYTDIEPIKYLILGLALGYCSHLLADSITVMGCPLLWPITEECVKVKIVTNKVTEYVMCAVLSAIIIWFGFAAGSNGEAFSTWITCMVAGLIGLAVPYVSNNIAKLMKKAKKKVDPVLIGGVLFVASLVLNFIFTRNITYIIAGTIGFIIGAVNVYHKRRK